MVQGHIFLKGGQGLALFLFNFLRFIIFTYRNYFTLCKILLCYAFDEKTFFFCHHNFMKIGHSKLSKNELQNIS